jgi:hypothetical protein
MPLQPEAIVASPAMDIQGCEPTRHSLAAEVLRKHGSLRLLATGTSMLPSVWPGDLLIIQSVGLEQVGLGDIVLSGRTGRFFVHRVREKSVEAGELRLITRGDCLPHDDPPVRRGELLGKVAKIRRRDRWVAPPRLSGLGRILACILSYSDLCQGLAFRLHAWRNGTSTGSSLLTGSGHWPESAQT